MSKQIEALKKALDDIEAEVRTTAGRTVFKSMARMRRMLEDGQDYTTTRNAWTGRETYKCNRCGREDFRSEHSAKFHECQTVEEQPARQNSPWCMKMNGCKTKCEDCPDEVAEQPAQPAPDYAWPTIADYEKEVGFEMNDAFKAAWIIARTTNDIFKQMGGDT